MGFEDECWWSRVALPTLSSLERGGQAPAPRPTVGRQRRPRAEGHLLLRALSARDRRDVAEVRGREAREFHNDAVPFVELREARSAGKKVLLLIWDNASWHISKEVRRWLGKHNRRVKESGDGVRIVSCLLAEAESVAERHRAQVGTRQAQGRRARRAARSIRACRQGLPGLRLSALRASLRSPEGRLIMH